MSEGATSNGRFSSISRAFALAAVILLVSAGLCGIQFIFQPNDYVTVEGVVGALGFLAGGGLLLGAAIGAAISFTMRLIQSRKGKP